MRIRERSLLLIYSSRSSNSSKCSRIRKVLKKNLIVRGLRMKEKGNGTTVFNILKKHVLIDMVYFLYLDVLVCSCEFCEWLNETIILYIIAKFCSLVFFFKKTFSRNSVGYPENVELEEIVFSDIRPNIWYSILYIFWSDNLWFGASLI